MHTADELSADTFRLHLDATPVAIDEVLAGLDRHDRLGLVVDRPLGGFGASTLVLAAITAFYDEQRARSDDFFVYPDHYAFHVGGRYGDHSMLDIWPDQKEVEVARDAEALLRAINDRAITRLLVPDVAAADPWDVFERQTLASARDRILTAAVYAPTGTVAGGNLTIRGSQLTESYVTESVRRTGAAPDLTADWKARRAQLLDDGVPVETYRPVPLDDALGRLAAVAAAG